MSLNLHPTSKVNIIKIGLLRVNTKIDRIPMRKKSPGATRNVGTTWLRIGSIWHKFFVIGDDAYFREDLGSCL